MDEAEQVPTPVGRRCLAECGDVIAEGDRGFMRGVVRVVDGKPFGSVEPIHAECELLGELGHQVGVCSCTGYGHDRAAARLVWERVGQMRGCDLGVRARVGDLVWLPNRLAPGDVGYELGQEICGEPGRIVEIEDGHAMVDRGSWGQFGCPVDDLRPAEERD